MVNVGQLFARLQEKCSEEKDNIEILSYKNLDSMAKFQCKKCGTVFDARPNTILKRHSNIYCVNCNNPNKSRAKTKNNIERIKEMFQKTPYLHLISTDFQKIQNDHSRLTVKYYCDRCEKISEVIYTNLSNNYFTCQHCDKGAKLSKEDFSLWMRNNYLTLSLLNEDDFNGQTSKVQIRCKECNFIFSSTVTSLRRENKIVCPKCKHGKSKQELYISDFLSKANICFETEVNYNWLPNRYMRYDFVLPNEKIIIEYMGEQHYKWTKYFHPTEKDFLSLQNNDKIKKELSLSHGYNYLAIPYTYKNRLKEILSSLLGSTTISKESRGKCLEIDSILEH